MFVSDVNKIKELDMGKEAKNVTKRILVGPDQGWDSHVMRLFRVKKGGFTPRHSHPWFHVNYVVSGEGILYLDGAEYKIKKDSVAYIPPNKEHQYINSSEDDLIFICIVPREGESI